MVKAFTLALSASAKRLSDVYGGTPGTPDEAKNIPYRQLLLTSSGADCMLGDASVSGTVGVKISATGSMPTSLGPFETGPIKLSDFYAVGAGSTLSVMGVPF